MYDKLIRRGVDFMFAYGDVSEENREVYSYGIELIIMYLINAGTLLILGMITGHFLETFLFLAGFALLQSFGGGYHAMTHFRCLVLMLVFWAVDILLIPIVQTNQVLCYVFAISGAVTVFVLAPVKHKNYPLSADKEKKMKKTVRYVTLILLVIVIAGNLIPSAEKFSAIFGIVLFLSAISMISASIKQEMQKE